MAAEHFKAAIDSTGMTPEQLAQVIEVDPKTVHRWLGGRVPYPRHRAAIARALDTPEYLLWPDDVPAPAPLPEPDQPSAREVPEEVIASWGGREDSRSMDMSHSFSEARRQVDILAPAPKQLLAPNTPFVLHRIANRGCRVRLVASSDILEIENLSPLTHHPQVQLRIHDEVIGHAVFRVDDAIYLGVWLAGTEGQPFIQATRQRDHGLFDAVTSHFERLWNLGQPYVAEPGSAATGSQSTPETPPDPTRSVRRWPAP